MYYIKMDLIRHLMQLNENKRVTIISDASSGPNYDITSRIVTEILR